jgi:hypothetical protein
MAERDTLADRETDADTQREPSFDADDLDVDALSGLPDRDAEPEREGLRSRLRRRAGSLFSPRAFGYAGAGSVVGALLLGTVLPIGGNVTGVLVAAFVYGALGNRHRYTEVAAAGGLVTAAFALVNNVFLTLAGLGVPLVVASALGGVAAGLVGHYLGRDLRDGLTREL